MSLGDKLTWGLLYYFVTLIVFVLGYGGVQYALENLKPKVEIVVVEKIVEKEVPSYVQVEVTTTGYCPGYPCVAAKWADGKTATGKSVSHGICASDWSVFPPGSKFIVPGYGSCIVEDSGNLVIGRHLDLYFHTAREARQWGRQITVVTLVRWGRGELL